MILYNGVTGGLGRYLATPLRLLGSPSHAIVARLEDEAGLGLELRGIVPGSSLTYIHLAARVSVPACEADPSGAFRTNVQLARSVVATVLEWASAQGASARVIYVSSGHVYAAQQPGGRLREDAPTAPRSVYAKTKLAAEQELHSICAKRETPFLAARVFGLLAPKQAPNYVLPALIDRARGARLEGIPGLDFARDYLDARDVCDDLLALAVISWPDMSQVVNVCSGVPVTIRRLLRAVVGEIFPERADELAMKATAAPGRPDDVPWLVGDPGQYEHLTGRPSQRIPLSETVADAVGRVEREVKASADGLPGQRGASS